MSNSNFHANYWNAVPEKLKYFSFENALLRSELEKSTVQNNSDTTLWIGDWPEVDVPEVDWPTMPGKDGKPQEPQGPSNPGPYNQVKRGDDAGNSIDLRNFSGPVSVYEKGTVFGRGGDDLIHGGYGTSYDSLHGDEGNDTIYAKGDGDLLFGGEGHDTLYADGSSNLFGGSGQDRLVGGNGSDLLDGGYGIDWLIGGRGADTFRFTQVDNNFHHQDGIQDFSRAEGDKIRLVNLFDGQNHIEVNGFDDLIIYDHDAYWTVYIDYDTRFGVVKGDYGMLQASDFIFG